MSKFRRSAHWYLLALLAFSLYMVWSAVFFVEAHRNRVFVHVFDIGQGDSLFIETPSGNHILIDGGPGSAVLPKLGDAMPFWDHSIDLIVLTHPHADHLTGLIEVLKRYRVGMVLESGVNHSIPEYTEWHRVIDERGIRVVRARAGERLRIGGGAFLDILEPEHNFAGVSVRNVHDAVVVSRLAYGRTTALLMGDAEKPLEYNLIASGRDLSADVLKVGHHGSKTSSTEPFLKRVMPRLAVISVGRKNPFGHPHQEVLDRLHAVGATILRTDERGDVTLISDGKNFVSAQ